MAFTRTLDKNENLTPSGYADAADRVRREDQSGMTTPSKPGRWDTELRHTTEASTMTDKLPILITELSEEERKSVEEWVKLLPMMLKQCECRLRHYGKGEENVIKTLRDMDVTSELIAEARAVLVKSHRYPAGS